MFHVLQMLDLAPTLQLSACEKSKLCSPERNTASVNLHNKIQNQADLGVSVSQSQRQFKHLTDISWGTETE